MVSPLYQVNLKKEESRLLHTVITSGEEIYSLLTGIISPENFSVTNHKLVFQAIQDLSNEGVNLNLHNIVTRLKTSGSGLSEEEIEELQTQVSEAKAMTSEECISTARSLRNKQIIKECVQSHKEAIENLFQTSVESDTDSIFSISEKSFFKTVKQFSNSNDSITEISSVTRGIVNEWEENPCQFVGLPTPWPEFNDSIGGGMRTGITLIGARSGIGKTSIGVVCTLFLAKNGVPCLIIDTEMSIKALLPRFISNMSSVPIKKIENGQFGNLDIDKNNVYKAVQEIENMNISHKSVAGKEFSEILSIIRRWVHTKVGINKETGKANQCFIVYDYFKMMNKKDVANMQEHAAFGYQVSELKDFLEMYDIPCMSFVQLNRDGIAKEDTDVIAQSDRILWNVNSFSLFKKKTPEEMHHDNNVNGIPTNKGNRKVITLKGRYGGEHERGEHINFFWNGETCSLQEIQSK